MLDFLRGAHLQLPSCEKELHRLWHEADFYGLEGLKDLIPALERRPRSFDFQSYGMDLLEGQEEVVAALDNLLLKLPNHPDWMPVLGNTQRGRLFRTCTTPRPAFLLYAITTLEAPRNAAGGARGQPGPTEKITVAISVDPDTCDYEEYCSFNYPYVVLSEQACRKLEAHCFSLLCVSVGTVFDRL